MIKEFKNQYRFLSNFFPSPLVHNNRLWPSVEHAYQALKTLDLSQQELIRHAKHAGIAKKLGKAVKLQPNWDNIKDQLMYELVWKKFRQNPDLAKLLLETNNEELQEGNWWGDTHFGVDIHTGFGYNILGKILMNVRFNYKNYPPPPCSACNQKGWFQTENSFQECQCY